MTSIAPEVTEPTAGVEETPTPTPAPAAPDASTPPAPASDEPAPAASETPPSTRPRDPATGRFIKSDGSVASVAEHEAIEQAAPAPTPRTPPAAPAPSSEPVTFRGAGQRVPIPGSSVDADGSWKIPAAATPGLRQLLAEGMEYRQNWRRRESEYKQQIETAGATERARAEKYNAAAVYLLDQVERAFEHQPDVLALMKREVGLMLREADLKIPAPARPADPDPQQVQERLVEAARSVLDEEVDALLQSPDARQVYATPEERTQVLARFQRRLNAYFVEQDDGRIALDRQVLQEDFQDEVTRLVQARKAVEEARKGAEFNAKRNAPAAVVPPVVSTKAPPARPGAPNAAQSREEWRRKNGMF